MSSSTSCITKLLCLGFLFVWSINCLAQDKTRISLPYDRVIQPAGLQIVFGDSAFENHALDCVLSPDEKWLAVEERYSILFINTKENKVTYRLPLKQKTELRRAMNTYSGICWHKRNNELFVLWSTVSSNQSFVVEAKWNGKTAEITRNFSYKAENNADMALPNEILIRKESGKEYLYVVLNGNNQLVKQDLATGDTIWIRPTGVAPYGIACANNKIYLTNWGGRVPLNGDKDVAGVPWGLARVDPATGAAREGSVSVIDPVSGKTLKEIVVGLHPNDIVASPDQKFVCLTNSNSDKVTVINSLTDEISETISLRLQEEINPFFGDSPNGLQFSKDGKILYVANGMDNAIAVITLGSKASAGSKAPESSVDGFIPTGAYPSSICISRNKKLYVTNLESEGADLPLKAGKNKTLAFNSHHMLASVSVIDVPGKQKLKEYTDIVIAVNQLSRLQSAQLPARSGMKPKPLPERIGEPSVFKHVLYIIKENRTYDQVLGDVPEGNGDTSLCIYGRKVTPNMHRLVKDYVLLDNFFASGKCSAEGHQWTDASIVTDYIEKNVRAWFRSYPHVQTDALVYSPTGFLWDNAMKHGKSVKIYGEASTPVFDKKLTWKDIYSGYLKGDSLSFKNETTIAAVRGILSQTYPAYDSHKIPDQLRAEAFIRELHQYEAMEGDHLPELMIMALPEDHTAGTSPGFPTPRAMVADNDLALGRIIEAFTHSKFYRNTAIFILEDDSQDGWDHVSAYRTVGLVISPYSRMQKTISASYNQPSMVRSIEQILGLPPMNIQDAIATPMFSCFSETMDTTSYHSVQNIIPLDEMNPLLSELRGKALHYAKLSMQPQFDGIDSGDDDTFNRILWFTAKGSQAYPKMHEKVEEEEEK